MNKSHKQRPSKVRLQDFDASKGLHRGASRFKNACWYMVKVLFFLSALPYPNALKIFLLRLFGAKIGKNITIKPRVNIHFPWKLNIGSHVWIGEEVFLLNFEQLTIGNNVCISQRAFICGGNHDFSTPTMDYRNGPITLEDGCWIGACCFIGPGVTIGIDSVVAAGSNVTQDIAANLVTRVHPEAFQKNRWK